MLIQKAKFFRREVIEFRTQNTFVIRRKERSRPNEVIFEGLLMKKLVSKFPESSTTSEIHRTIKTTIALDLPEDFNN